MRMAETLNSKNQQPSVWKNCRVEDFCTTASGGTPLTTRRDYYDEGHIPWLRSGEVSQGRVRHAEISITQAGLDNSSAKLFKKGTILVAMYGATAGEVGILEFESSTNQAVCGITPGPSVDGEFLFQALLLRKPALIKMAGGGAQPNISQEIIRNFKIPLPPLAEQRKIAEILRTWDEAIETAEAELNAKLERKRWLMDRLFKFSPESHLEQVKMQDAVDVLKGEQLNRHTLAEKGSYPVWNGGITPSGYTESCNTEGPAVIMSEGGNSCGAITRVNENFWRGGHCYHVVPRNGFSNDYLFAALKYYEPQIMRLRVGSGLPNIQKKAFLSWGAPLHKPAYRDKVASVFTHAQLEGELANKHIGTLRAQKRGLMQKLLTGEVRVAA